MRARPTLANAPKTHTVVRLMNMLVVDLGMPMCFHVRVYLCFGATPNYRITCVAAAQKKKEKKSARHFFAPLALHIFLAVGSVAATQNSFNDGTVNTYTRDGIDGFPRMRSFAHLSTITVTRSVLTPSTSPFPFNPITTPSPLPPPSHSVQ